jgi:transcriptional regulator with XRE-family HTH domain
VSGKTYLHELRRNRDFALGEVARGIGVKPSDLSKIERGRAPLTDELCASLAKLLAVTESEVRAGVPDAAEVEADESRMLDMLAALSAVQAEATTQGYGRGNGGRGSFLCPICKRGQLNYSVAGVNGHIWGRCTTDGCVAWMQ